MSKWRHTCWIIAKCSVWNQLYKVLSKSGLYSRELIFSAYPVVSGPSPLRAHDGPRLSHLISHQEKAISFHRLNEWINRLRNQQMKWKFSSCISHLQSDQKLGCGTLVGSLFSKDSFLPSSLHLSYPYVTDEVYSCCAVGVSTKLIYWKVLSFSSLRWVHYANSRSSCLRLQSVEVITYPVYTGNNLQIHMVMVFRGGTSENP